jgi:threonine synthase
VILATAHPVKFGDVVEPLIEAHIHIPERLKSIISGKKQSVLMSADFDVFKNLVNDKVITLTLIEQSDF